MNKNEGECEHITTVTKEMIHIKNFIDNIVEMNWSGKRENDQKMIFELVSIDKMEQDEEIKTELKKLQKLNVDSNNLTEIKLKSYVELTELYAQNNQISMVELKLPLLMILNLSGNNLTQLFELIDLPNLKELNLSKNSICEISYDNLKNVKTTLRLLDLSDNLINFADVSYFFNCFDNIGAYMKSLITLNLINNPFTKKNKFRNHYQTYIRIACPYVQILNGKDFSNSIDSSKPAGDLKGIKERMALLEQTEDETLSNVQRNNASNKVTLQTINQLMDKMNQYDLINEKTLNELQQNIYTYLKNPFALNEDDSLADPDLDDFEQLLDSLDKIIENVSKEDEKILYRIICNFAIIRNGKFASRALSNIKQRICGDNIEQINCGVDVLYTFIYNAKINQIPINLINNLYIFLDEPNFIAVLQLILKRIVQYTKEVSKKITVDKQYMNDNDLKTYYLNLHIYNAFLNFIGKSILFPEFENEIIKYDFIYECITDTKFFMNNSDDDIIQDDDLLSILCNLLLIIRVTSIKKINELLPALTGSGIRDRLEQRLGLSLKTVLGKTVLDESSKNLKKMKQEFKKKTLIISFMRCFGALLSCSEEISRFLSNTNITMKIVEILSQKDFLDPLILHGACDFTYYFLLNESLIKSASDFSYVASKLYNLRYLMPLLFPNKQEFIKICKVADTFGDHVIERGKPISLQYMDSPIINNLFISLVRLISIFGKYANLNLPVSQKCLDICYEMNNLNRDAGLTNCLTLPNEDVKLSVMECFYSIDINSLDPEELINMYRQLKNLSSMSSKMQYVVSIMVLILNKWFVFNLMNNKFDKIETCKEAIFILMNLLCKNDLSKSAYETLNKNKTYLSAMISVFLINISTFPETKKYFEDPKKKQELIEYLLTEENSVQHMNVGFPLEFEKCFSGWSVSDYVHAFQNEILFPYNYISLRVLLHIADILSNKPYPMFELNLSVSIDDHMDLIVNEMKKREIQRIKEESMNWREAFQIKENYKYAVKLKEEQVVKEQKEFIKNYSIFLDFMFGQLSSKEISKMNKIWETKLSKDIDSVKYSLNDNPKDLLEEENIDEENIINNKDENKDIKNNDDNSKEKNNVDSNLYPILLYYLRREDYNTGKVISSNDLFAYISNELFSYHRYGYEEQLIREFSEETPNNPYIRSLCVSAFLRCIYSILEYSINKEDKENMILILYSEDNIKQLCLLAECTKLSDNFIATKLLVIMRHLLRNVHLFLDSMESNKIKSRDELNNEYLQKLGYISYMIKRTIKLYKKDLSLEKDDHKILLSELCQCCLMIITQLRLLPFENDEFKENTILKMIDFEVIRVLIQMIKNYMNKEAENKGNVDQNSPGNKLLQEMVFVNITIIGEYMASCESRRYDILENFTRAYTFERCKLRKTIIKEILNNCICSKQKNKLLMELKDNTSTLNLVAPCYVAFNKENGNNIESRIFTLAVTDNTLEFFELDDLDSFYREEKMNRKKNLSIKIDDIRAMLLFEFPNRCVLETEKQYIIFYFYRINVSSEFRNILKEINNKIEIFETVAIFTKEIKQKEKKQIPKKEENTPTPEENKETPKENENKEELENKINKENKINNDNKIVMISCKYKQHTACNIFLNMFKKKMVIKDACVLVIMEGQIKMYVEKVDAWNELNYNNIFNDARFYKKGVSMMHLRNDFEDCYEPINVIYDISEFDTIKIEENNNILLSKSGKNHCDQIQIFDDGSYVKLKNALNYIEDFESYDNC